jgi:hypothetical protein
VATSAGRAKRDREKQRQERQALKRARRQGSRPPTEDGSDAEVDVEQAAPTSPPAPQDELLERLAELHQQFADGKIDFEAFEQTKEELIADLEV